MSSSKAVKYKILNVTGVLRKSIQVLGSMMAFSAEERYSLSKITLVRLLYLLQIVYILGCIRGQESTLK